MGYLVALTAISAGVAFVVGGFRKSPWVIPTERNMFLHPNGNVAVRAETLAVGCGHRDRCRVDRRRRIYHLSARCGARLMLSASC